MNATNPGVQITGSLVVSGSNTFTNVGPMKTGAANNVAAGFAFAQGSMVSASGLYSHAEGFDTNASGTFSHAEGQNTLSQGGSSHAEGVDTSAIGDFSHAEGYGAISSGYASHAEGYFTLASASYQHTQGIYNIASDVTGAFIIGNGSGPSSRSNLIFAAGNQVEITGSLVVTGGITGTVTTASYATVAQTLLGSVVSASFASTASYINPTFISASAAASGFGSGGGSTIDTGSFATTGSNAFFGNQSVSGSVTVTGSINHVGSLKTGIAANVALNNSLANGFNISASGQYSHAEGYEVHAKSIGTHAEGYGSSAGLSAWDTNGTFDGLSQLPSSIGNVTSSLPSGTNVMLGTLPLVVSRSFFQANLTQVEYVGVPNLNLSAGNGLAIINPFAILSQITYPNQTLTVGEFSHAEGSSNIALFGHAEGSGTVAYYGHAEGGNTISRGEASHAEGGNTTSIGIGSHSEGSFTTASGDYSHAEGLGTVATGSYQHVQGQYNTHGDDTSLMIVGNGTSDIARKDAFKVRMSGSIVLPTTQSAAPSWTGTDGEMVFATVTGDHYFYVWMSGAWRSGSLA
jgi:trimeric autotransporter adhesin